MPYDIPTIDVLLDRILTDYRNLGGEVDTETFLRSSCLASALWGAYRHQEQVSLQIFPDTSDPKNLEHHFWARTGQARKEGETDAELLARLLTSLRQPPAGGNKYDYVAWALEIQNVKGAWSFPLAQGLGTVDVVITADEDLTGDETPSTSCRTGVSTSVSAGKLVDSAATFNTGLVVRVGSLVENTTQQTRSTVVTRDSNTQLTLADDIFKYENDNYQVYMHSGTATSVSAGKLVDSAADFDNATYTAKKGDIVENLTTGQSTTLVTVDSGTQLTLEDDIFTANGQSYVVRSLCAQVKKYIDTVRPVTGSRTSVVGPTITLEDVTMTVGGNPNKVTIKTDIEAYMNAFIPGQTLSPNPLMVIAINDGSEDANVTVPAAPVVPAAYEMIRPGTVSVT